jgi:TRAP-type uncharacterized transport system fused permease subunit
MLFFEGQPPAVAAIWATGVLTIFGLAFSYKGRKIKPSDIYDVLATTGLVVIELLMIVAAAGFVIGVLHMTGLGPQLPTALIDMAGNNLWIVLAFAAVVCIILGMGMPTAAVYVVLVSIVAPALVEMNIPEMSAHMFIFYFGLLSMLTPPVAVASMVAAQLAGADMWKTGLIGLQLAAAAFLMPFLWVFNPALLLDGTGQEIALVTATSVVAGMLIGRMSMVMAGGVLNVLAGFGLLAAAIVVGSATVWIGPADPLSLVPAGVGLILMYGLRFWRQRSVLKSQQA